MKLGRMIRVGAAGLSVLLVAGCNLLAGIEKGKAGDCSNQPPGGDPDCLCVPGTVEPCYSGPPGTEDVGVCRGGVKHCLVHGLGYGKCEGEVVPTPEVCDGYGRDENCNGIINEEGAKGVCGDGCKAADEECDDGNTSAFDGCTEHCKLPVCGDGSVAYGETCDDGNLADGDGCPSTCLWPIRSLVAGGDNSCAVLVDGHLKCWGNATDGEVGQGEFLNDLGDEPGEIGDKLPPVALGKDVVAVALGYYHECALLDGGTIKCWGENLYGKLGLGDTDNRGDEPNEMGDNLPDVDLGQGQKAIAIAAGGDHTCALLESQRIKCWGSNDSGQLGIGIAGDRGDDPDEMGDNLPAVDLGADAKALAVAAGYGHTCALLVGGSVKCWGLNISGQLGQGHNESLGLQADEMGDNLPAVDLGAGVKVVAITTGDSHTCALLDDQHIKCWGENWRGQLGLGDFDLRGDYAENMGDALPTVDLGMGHKAFAVIAGAEHTCALIDGDSIKCWGANDDGELGLGDDNDHGDEENEMGDALQKVDLGVGKSVDAVTAGGYHTCALLNDGRAKCWGANIVGQLGLGDTLSRGRANDQMGDNLPLVAP